MEIFLLIECVDIKLKKSEILKQSVAIFLVHLESVDKFLDTVSW